MIAKELELLLSREARSIGFTEKSPAELVQRFQALRGCGLLPRGRGKNAQHLSTSEAAAAILSLIAENPSYAGHVAIVIRNLRPVGGTGASINNCETFGKSIEHLLCDDTALSSVVEVRVSCSEVSTNAHGRASIAFNENSGYGTVHFVGNTAVSLLQAGAEKSFDPRDFASSIMSEIVFYPRFFARVSKALRDKNGIPPYVESDEDDPEIKAERRNERLGVQPGARYLNVGVDCQVTWPREETPIEFEGKKLILMPKTKDNTTSIHIDLNSERLSHEDARTIINRFLSLMTWCDDQFAILEEGWSGNPIPVAVPRTNLAFSTAYHWWFSRKLPASDKAKRALAIYREARNAQQNHMIPYAVLCYYKLVELKYKGRNEAKKWFAENLELLRSNKRLTESIDQFDAEVLRSNKRKAEDYLWEACRCAIAHANKPYSIDADDHQELKRLYIAADVLRALARIFIKNEFDVSASIFDGS